MAKVAVAIPGRDNSFVNASPISELKRTVGVNSNFTASVNGSPVEDDYVLSENQFVVLAAPVKGG